MSGFQLDTIKKRASNTEQQIVGDTHLLLRCIYTGYILQGHRKKIHDQEHSNTTVDHTKNDLKKIKF